MPSEVTVTNPAYWSDRPLQLAQVLRTTGAGPGPQTIGDPSGRSADPDHRLAIADPEYWSTQPRELGEVLAAAAQGMSGTPASPGLPATPAAAPATQERLTLTVEEAAQALGISRAFAYEAVTRKQIPHVRIGRRILIPRAALERMLKADTNPTDEPAT
jgi:excisionase family DNA binding protein